MTAVSLQIQSNLGDFQFLFVDLALILVVVFTSEYFSLPLPLCPLPLLEAPVGRRKKGSLVAPSKQRGALGHGLHKGRGCRRCFVPCHRKVPLK